LQQRHDLLAEHLAALHQRMLTLRQAADVLTDKVEHYQRQMLVLAPPSPNLSSISTPLE
jgi:uncharacterized coiled-coil DUF342 family protein